MTDITVPAWSVKPGDLIFMEVEVTEVITTTGETTIEFKTDNARDGRIRTRPSALVNVARDPLAKLKRRVADAMFSSIDDEGIDGRLSLSDCAYLADVAVLTMQAAGALSEP